MKYLTLPKFLFLAFLISSLFTSCGIDPKDGDEECAVHDIKTPDIFFDRGDYSFSCMDDNGAITVEFPHLSNNHLLIPSSEDAAEYIVFVDYKETDDGVFSQFLFAKTFADQLMESRTPISDLGEEAYFYEIDEETLTRHYILFKNCNFMSSISGDFEKTEDMPCNLGKDAMVAFAKEIKNNI